MYSVDSHDLANGMLREATAFALETEAAEEAESRNGSSPRVDETRCIRSERDDQPNELMSHNEDKHIYPIVVRIRPAFEILRRQPIFSNSSL